MDTQAFQHLLSQLDQLSVSQRSWLQRTLYLRPRQDVLNQTLPDLRACPHCGADAAQLAPWGWSRELRRYRCRVCHRTSNALSSTPLAHRARQIAGWTMPRR